ncbi:MAG: phenylalanine--tRNA ligase subunit alpha, partial [Proteobacteria bacterium]|nr:phenylalanine--tRNA ligase subunit alpha [Pseudomonadota bacterium]
MNNLENLLNEAINRFDSIDNTTELEQAKAHYLGKSGVLTEMLRGLGKLSPEERPAMGGHINKLKEALETTINCRRETILSKKMEAQLTGEALDVTLSGRGLGMGGLHPVTRTLERIESLFRSIGFTVASGPEIETDFYNFTALNIPENHPARAMHDTFYFPGGKLLRTHTSPVQIRSMVTEGVPIRIIAPGRVYRCDSDQTHTPMFHQVEGLVIDHGISFANLKAALHQF